jgi:hypothetical protein
MTGLAMAHKLDLFEAPTKGCSETMGKARLFTAWSFFSWQVLSSYYFPPAEPLPDPVCNPAWYGEVWIRYPQTQVLTRLQLSHTITARIQMHIILNELASQLFGDPDITGSAQESSQLSFERALELKAKVDAYLNRLQGPLAPEAIVFPIHFQIQLVISRDIVGPNAVC